MRYNFRSIQRRINGIVKLDEYEFSANRNLRSLGSINAQDGEIDDDIVHLEKNVWLKWRGASGALYDHYMPFIYKKKLQDSLAQWYCMDMSVGL